LAKGRDRICPKCKEAIKVDASICKHCGTEFTPDEVAAAKAEAKQGAKYAGVGCLVLVFALGTCTYVLGKGDPVPKVPEKPTATAKADAIAFYRRVSEAVRSCDKAGSEVSDAISAGDPVGTYSAADAMDKACLNTPSKIKAIAVPESAGKVSFDKLTKIREVCENLYVQKWSSASKMKAVLDNDGKISARAELRDSTQAIETGNIMCSSGILAEVMRLGAEPKDLVAN